MYFGFVRNKFDDTPLTFAKGLIAALNGTEPPKEPHETYFKVFYAKTLEDIGKWAEDGHGMFWGSLGRCYEVINFASGGLYWADDLKKGVFNGPQEFTVHVWKKVDDYHYESVLDWTFTGVRWTDVRHGDDQGVSDCWGMASFTYEDKLENVAYVPMECRIPTTVKYPSLYLGQLLFKYSKERLQNEKLLAV